MIFKCSSRLLKVLLVIVAGMFLFNSAFAADDSKKKAKSDVKTEQAANAEMDDDKPSATITKGMPEAEVLKLLGEPHTKKKMKASDGGYVEFWNYKRVVGQREEFRVTGSEMEEQWSPSLQEFIQVPVEIEELVTTTISQLVEIIMHDGKVLTFKADLHQDIDVK